MPSSNPHSTMYPRHRLSRVTSVDENPHDYYETPIAFCREVVEKLLPYEPKRVLDPGCGSGAWGEAVKDIYPDCYVEGIDENTALVPNPRYDMFSYGDFLTSRYGSSFFDLVIGNPPYGNTNGHKDPLVIQRFLFKSLDLLQDGQYVILLLRLNYLESERRKALFTEYPPETVVVCSRKVPFMVNGEEKSLLQHGIFFWKKGYTGETTLKFWSWGRGQGKP